MLLTEQEKASVHRMERNELEKMIRSLLDGYSIAREIWVDVETFEDFYNLFSKEWAKVSSKTLTLSKAYALTLYFERYHNIGGSSHKLA